jgi:hypothetical protein
MRYWSNLRETVADSSTLLQTLVNETDGWIDDNQVGYNTALSSNNLTPAQKTLIFCAVALIRVDPGVAALLRRALGVDSEA